MKIHKFHRTKMIVELDPEEWSAIECAVDGWRPMHPKLVVEQKQLHADVERLADEWSEANYW